MKTIIVLAVLCMSVSANAALILVNGQLQGFKNINVDGIFYNIELDTSSCAQIYDGCDNIVDFPFSTSTAANALEALRGDLEFGLLNNLITSIKDCDFDCFFAIADGLQNSDFLQSQIFVNGTTGSVSTVSRALGTDNRTGEIFAVYTEVPEPFSIAIFSFGLICLVLRRVKKQF